MSYEDHMESLDSKTWRFLSADREWVMSHQTRSLATTGPTDEMQVGLAPLSVLLVLQSHFVVFEHRNHGEFVLSEYGLIETVLFEHEKVIEFMGFIRSTMVYPLLMQCHWGPFCHLPYY
jgi:hypothetical protein